MFIVPLAVIGIFIVIGILLYNGKGSFLIAGYNTLPREEKEKFDTDALCKFMGKIMFALSFSMMFWVVSEALKIKILFTAGLVLFFCIVIFTLIYANTGNRFKK